VIWPQDRFNAGLGISLFVHAGLFMGAGSMSWHRQSRAQVEIDLTQPVHIGRTSASSARAVATPPKAPAPVQPSDFQKKDLSAPAAPVTPIAPSTPEAEPHEQATLSRLPQLENLNQLGPLLQRYYPESERLTGREGRVTLEIYINEEGHVADAVVITSAGVGFDKAAVRVARMLHFTPALRGAERVGVKMRQTFEFRMSQ